MSTTSKTSLARASVGIACLLAFAGPAQAIVSTSASSNWVASTLDAVLGTSGSLDGVAKLVINGSTGCSGTLLAGGAYVLTAAHCVTDSNGHLDATSIAVSFKAGAVTDNVSQASQISVFSTWQGQQVNGAGLGANNDLALLKLDSKVTAVSGYSLYTGNSMGSGVILAGYGLTGVGNSGAVAHTFGTLHWGLNQYELLYQTGGSYLYDFDDGSAAKNIFSAYTTSSTGAGPYEAMIASGDSGGSSFVLANDGSLQLVGVHSFGGSLTGNPISAYGEYGGDTVFNNAQTQSWLAAVTSVPEPGSYAMLLAGLAGLGFMRRRAAR
jgi:secreted trypsin-like serine protease